MTTYYHRYGVENIYFLSGLRAKMQAKTLLNEGPS